MFKGILTWKSNFHFRLFVMLLGVCILTIIPLPIMLSIFRPPWMLLFVLYIQFYYPQYFNVTLLLFFGLCLDVLLATVMGEHAFALLLATAISANKARRFYFFSIVQQMILVATFCFIYQSAIVLIDAFQGYRSNDWIVLSAPLLGFLCWPWVRVLADNTLCYDGRF